MPTAHDVDAKINDVITLSNKVLKQESEAGYQDLQTIMFALEGLARETFQAKLEDLYWPILAKLEQGQALTTAEHEVLEMLMVGDAKYYVRYETHLDEWRSELTQLLDEIKKRQASGLDTIDSLMKLRALCRETMRVLPDLAYYFREKERIGRFETATSGAIDIETRRSLANLIKDMMESDQL